MPIPVPPAALSALSVIQKAIAPAQNYIVSTSLDSRMILVLGDNACSIEARCGHNDAIVQLLASLLCPRLPPGQWWARVSVPHDADNRL
jgi:hypothetical protein